MKLIRIIFDFFRPNSRRNIDSHINYYRDIIIKNGMYTSDIAALESSIVMADEENKYVLKIEFKNKLKDIYDDLVFEALKDTIDRTW